MVVHTHESHRHPSDPQALTVWLQLARSQAQHIDCPAGAFIPTEWAKLLPSLRPLSRLEPTEFFPELVSRCAAAGVAVVAIPAIQGVRASAVAALLQPGRYMIALSTRYKREDHFWFSFFVAACALANQRSEARGQQSEANGQQPAVTDLCPPTSDLCRQAADLLIPPADAAKLTEIRSPTAIVRFARETDIAEGIVVGRMLHEGLLEWSDRLFTRLRRSVDLSWVLAGQEAVASTWISVSEAGAMLLRDLPHLSYAQAKSRVSSAANRGQIMDNQERWQKRRVAPDALARWRLDLRDQDLDAEAA